MSTKPSLYEHARDAQIKHAKFLLELHGKPASSGLFAGYIAAYALALHDLVGAKAAAEFTYQVADHLVARGVPAAMGINAVWDAINRGGEAA